MASQQRNERLLMRQRGAGREVKSTDFGLNFGFPTTRISGRGSRSRSKTPSTQAQKTSRASQSSVRRSREPSQARTRRSISVTSDKAQGSVKDASANQVPALTIPRSTKRRRTTIYEQTAEKVPEPSPVINGEEARPSVDPEPTQHENNDQKENYPPGEQKSRPKKRKRKSIGQQSMRKRKRSSQDRIEVTGPVTASPATSLSPVIEARAPSIELGSDTLESRDRHAENSHIVNVESGKATKFTKKKRKRKSITFKRRKRTSSETDRKPSRQDSTESTAVSEADSVIPSDEGDNSEDDYVEQDDSPDPPTPNPVRRGNTSRNNRTKGEIVGKTRSAGSKTSFPILTQRLTNLDMLPTIDELGESDIDSEEESPREAERKMTRDRPVPNTVDVLAQYCRETVESAVERLEIGTSSNRAERKRKQTALEGVGHELNDRLFEMSAAIEHRIQLESRARRAKRARADLQARWLEVRRQREEVALRCDHIRQQNWEREREREAKWQLSEAAHKLEVEVDRTDPEGDEPLEYILRTVAGNVGDIQGGGGLLDRIKSFNGRLERMAGVLEGRN